MINFTENSMRCTLQLMVATTCGRKHKPPHYTTQEDGLTDQRWNQTQEFWLTFLSEIAAQDARDTPCPGHRYFENSSLISWAWAGRRYLSLDGWNGKPWTVFIPRQSSGSDTWTMSFLFWREMSQILSFSISTNNTNPSSTPSRKKKVSNSHTWMWEYIDTRSTWKPWFTANQQTRVDTWATHRTTQKAWKEQSPKPWSK